MVDLKLFAGNGKVVNIKCTDGTEYKGYFVFGYTPYYDNYERNEDSIDILKTPDSKGGVCLYQSEILSIEFA